VYAEVVSSNSCSRGIIVPTDDCICGAPWSGRPSNKGLSKDCLSDHLNYDVEYLCGGREDGPLERRSREAEIRAKYCYDQYIGGLIDLGFLPPQNNYYFFTTNRRHLFSNYHYDETRLTPLVPRNALERRPGRPCHPWTGC
jgi:hypothetical protein